MIKRGRHFVEVAFFLSKYGKSDPPVRLETKSWKEAYHMFYEKLNEGREILTFVRSLKHARDDFDSHFSETEREGWKDKEGHPKKLSKVSLEVFSEFNQLSEAEVWNRISTFSNLDIKDYRNIFEDLIAVEESEKVETTSKTEGGVKVFLAKRVERNPSLRNDAFKIHGYDCMVCGFNFKDSYGAWGKNWAEVHHIKPISDKKEEKTITDPKEDLAVLCANCHRMIHKKKNVVLTLDELKKKLVATKPKPH